MKIELRAECDPKRAHNDTIIKNIPQYKMRLVGFFDPFNMGQVSFLHNQPVEKTLYFNVKDIFEVS